MIEQVTWNRAEDDVCVSCGTDLISPKDALLKMCTDCLKEAQEAAKKQIKNRNNRTGTVKRLKFKISLV